MQFTVIYIHFETVRLGLYSKINSKRLLSDWILWLLLLLWFQQLIFNHKKIMEAQTGGWLWTRCHVNLQSNNVWHSSCVPVPVCICLTLNVSWGSAWKQQVGSAILRYRGCCARLKIEEISTTSHEAPVLLHIVRTTAARAVSFSLSKWGVQNCRLKTRDF